MEDKIVEINNKIKHNQFRCPNCGSTEILYDKNNKVLKCSYCLTCFIDDKVEDIDISKLEGRNIGLGAKDIKDNDIVTINCYSCGANIVIDSKEAPYARCHWCRSILSLDNKVENGAVPDVILPFSVSREEAFNIMKEYLKHNKFFTKKDFINDLTLENVIGTYLPYMLVDTHVHCFFSGSGEHLVRSHWVSVGEDRNGYTEYEERYDADLYELSREFDIEIDDLTVESSKDKENIFDANKANNIINSILPFDTENCIPFKANYLIGYSTEKRDMNINDIENKVSVQIKDICRLSINKDLDFFDRGIKWEKEDINTIGKKWVSASLPVWLYSYTEKKKKKEVIHYIAVNGRTKEISGSTPFSVKKLLIFCSIIQLIVLLVTSIIYVFVINKTSNTFSLDYIILLWPFFLIGFILFIVIYFTVGNKGARHYYEQDTKYKLYNIKRKEEVIKRKHGLSNRYMYGANNQRRDG